MKPTLKGLTMDPENVPRSEYQRPASVPGLVAVGLATVLVVVLATVFWHDRANTTVQTDNSPRVERAPSTPAVKPPSDFTQPVPKAPG